MYAEIIRNKMLLSQTCSYINIHTSVLMLSKMQQFQVQIQHFRYYINIRRIIKRSELSKRKIKDSHILQCQGQRQLHNGLKSIMNDCSFFMHLHFHRIFNHFFLGYILLHKYLVKCKSLKYFNRIFFKPLCDL